MGGKEEGQSTVEFALTLILLMGFILFFLQLSLVFGFANYAHYITFMSARAYLSAGPSGAEQVDRAKSVITNTLKQSELLAGRDAYPMIAQGQGGSSGVNGLDFDLSQYTPGERDSSWMRGVRYTFRSRLFLIPLAGSTPASNAGGAVNSLTLTSESFLGREPEDDLCVQQMQQNNNGYVVYDNGC